jgi:2-polyprenyl-3-methyl-5-hydroxy-6-metoxy-1,4-benzoquinol methylase
MTARAEFVARSRCIACESTNIVAIAHGRFSDEPVRGYIERDPWGESPLPYLQDHPWELMQCQSCEQLFHKWLLTPHWQEIRFSKWMSEAAIREFEAQHDFNSPQAKFDKGVYHVQHVLRVNELTRDIRGSDQLRFLDFGCGWGELLTVANYFGFRAIGIDRSPSRQRISQELGVSIVPDLAAARQLAGAAFHAVTLFQVLEHIEEPLELLQAIHENLVPGGALVLEVPNCEGVRGFEKESDYYNAHPLEHINCFTPKSLNRFAERAGFRSVPTPVAHVTSSGGKAMRSEVGRLVRRWRPMTTNQCFQRV